MPRSRLTLALLVLVLLATACGSGEDTDTAERAEGAPSATSDMSEDEPRDSDEADTEPEPLGNETDPPQFPWSETAPPRFPFCRDYQYAWERHDASLQAALAAFMDYTQAEATVRDATDELDRAEAVEVRDGLQSRARDHMGEYASTGLYGGGEASEFLSQIRSLAEGGAEHRMRATVATTTTEPKTAKEVAYTRALDAFSSVATTEELVLLTNFDDIFDYWTGDSSTSLGNHEWGTALGLFVGAQAADPLPKSPALEASVAILPAVEVFVRGTLTLTSGAIYGVEPPSIEAVPELEDAVDDFKAAARAAGLPVDLLDSLADAVAEAAVLDRQQGSRYSRDLATFLYRVVAMESLTGSDAWRAAHQSLIESCRVT